MPGHSEEHRVTIGYGRKVLLTTSATVHSIEILNGGKKPIPVCFHGSSKGTEMDAKSMWVGLVVEILQHLLICFVDNTEQIQPIQWYGK